jgi:hypothetical protein
MIAPTAITVEPRRITFGLPSQSPVKTVLRAPKKQPILYTDVIVPCVVADGWPRYVSISNYLPYSL